MSKGRCGLWGFMDLLKGAALVPKRRGICGVFIPESKPCHVRVG